MKAILIDPARRSVCGIEVELTTLSAVFHPRNIIVKIALSLHWVDSSNLLVRDQNAHPHSKAFVLDTFGRVLGRGLLVGYKRDGKGPVSTLLTVGEVERFVRFP